MYGPRHGLFLGLPKRDGYWFVCRKWLAIYYLSFVSPATISAYIHTTSSSSKMAQNVTRGSRNNPYSTSLRRGATNLNFDAALYPPLPQEHFNIGMLFVYTVDDMVQTTVCNRVSFLLT